MPLALQQYTLTDEVMLMDCTLPAFTLDDTLPTISLLWRVQLDGWAKITPGRNHETFSAWLCALDLFIPLDALGQKKTWVRPASRGWWGGWGYRLRWVVQMAG